MTTTTAIILAATLAAMLTAVLRHPSARIRNVATASSPLDEAQRILARRYARGQITYDEYLRMTALLRR